MRVKLPHSQTVQEFPIGSRVGWDNADWPTLEITTELPVGTAAAKPAATGSETLAGAAEAH